jgi:hypothetical protein
VDWDWNRIVFDHVHLGVRDRDASMAFYSAVLEPLGIRSGRTSAARSSQTSS